MASGDGLGRVLNIIPTADGVEVALVGAGAITFVGVGASDTYTLQECTDAAGTGAQDLAVIDRYHRNTSGAGAAAWTAVSQTAAATATTGAGDAAAVFTVRSEQLSDGFDYVRVTSTGAGLVYAIAHDLHVQRAAENLPALGV